MAPAHARKIQTRREFAVESTSSTCTAYLVQDTRRNGYMYVYSSVLLGENGSSYGAKHAYRRHAIRKAAHTLAHQTELTKFEG